MKKTLLPLLLLICCQFSNAQTLTFIDKADMITPRAGISGANYNGFEYMSNGFNGPTAFTTQIEKYNYTNNTWSDFPTSIPTVPKRFGNAEIVNGILYLYNGSTPNGNNNKLEIIELGTGNVTVSATLNPSPVYSAGSATFGDYLLSFGGCFSQGIGSYSNKFYKIDPFGTWTPLPDMPEALEAKGAVVYGNGSTRLYSFGGYSEANSMYEDFQTTVPNTDLSLPNWINVAETGTKLFQAKSFGAAKYAQMNPYTGVVADQEPSNKVWLVSPNITVASTANTFLSFNTTDAYNNGVATLQAYVVTNWTGDILTSAKTLLSAYISSGHTAAVGDFVNSGQIELTGIPNNFRIAFKYTGGFVPVATAQFQIDQVRVYQQKKSDKIHIYDFFSNQWSTAATTLPVGISAHSVVVDDAHSDTAKIYVTGDYDNQTFLGMYDVASGNFTTINQTNMIGRRHHKAELFANKLYLFGGNTSSDSFSAMTSTQSADLAVLDDTAFKNDSSVSLYPNPATDKVSFNADVKEASLYTIDGKKINLSMQNNGFDVSGLTKGIYLVQGILANGNHFSNKLIRN